MTKKITPPIKKKKEARKNKIREKEIQVGFFFLLSMLNNFF